MQSLDENQKKKIRLIGLAAQMMLESGGEILWLEGFGTAAGHTAKESGCCFTVQLVRHK